MRDFIREAINVVPSQRQLDWQKTEFYSFIHFGINTFTDAEWGHGTEDTKLFNPTEFDGLQWAKACKDAGMGALILTCKHHDGFCLWPSKYTEYSVKNSTWKDGKGDIVKEVSEACKEVGIKFGVYLSPWDRNAETYGDSPAYDDFFKKQLTELLTNYGEIFCVWFDGACGEGPNGKKQVYDWNSYYELIRELQPKAVINVCGPDVRWCGNEAGHCRTSEWSVVPYNLLDTEKIRENSQKVDDGEFITKINAEDDDLGSREMISRARKLVWFPCEVNTSIRPGWFYHASQDDKVRSLDELLKIYVSSVGGNACFLLNLPPDKRGLIHENDVKRLKELGDAVKEMFKNNVTVEAEATASEEMDSCHNSNNVLNCDEDSFWCPNEGTETPYIELDLKSEKSFDKALLMEHIKVGQRVESFTIEYKENDEWKTVFEGTTIGYKRICSFDKVTARYVRFNVTSSRIQPTLQYLGLYDSNIIIKK